MPWKARNRMKIETFEMMRMQCLYEREVELSDHLGTNVHFTTG